MKTNLKVAMSAIALAALAAAPAVAKSHAQERANTQPPAYVNDQVVVDGKVIGADPDAHIRIQLRRDGLWYRD
jgi:hypothetical protein